MVHFDLLLIGGFRSLSFRLEIGPQWYQVGIALFAPTIPVDVLRVKSYVNSVFISRYVCTNVGLDQ